MPNALVILAERFPAVAKAIRGGDLVAKIEISEEQADQFRGALALIPEDMIEDVSRAGERLAEEIGAAGKRFVEDIGTERIAVVVMQIMAHIDSKGGAPN